MLKKREKTGSREAVSLPLHHESAVSPVIGVMFMLVVTVIVAALVSSFASGLGSTAEPAPTTAFEISIRAGDAVGRGATSSGPGMEPECVVLTVVSGETLHSRDLKIITTYTVPNLYNGVPVANAGKVIKHTLDGSIGQDDVWDSGADPFIHQVNGYRLSNTALRSLAPGNGMVGAAAPYFGDCLFKPGEPYWFKDRSAFLGFDITDRAAYGFQEGSVVHIIIVHTPTGQTIYDREVTVAW